MTAVRDANDDSLSTTQGTANTINVLANDTFTSTTSVTARTAAHGTVVVNGSQVNAGASDLTAVGTIMDNDTNTFASGDVTITDGNSGTQNLTFTVTQTESVGRAELARATGLGERTIIDSNGGREFRTTIIKWRSKRLWKEQASVSMETAVSAYRF